MRELDPKKRDRVASAWAAWELSATEIAKEFGVDFKTVRRIAEEEFAAGRTERNPHPPPSLRAQRRRERTERRCANG